VTKRAVVAGIALVGVYLAILGATHARVLYDGFVPPPKYQFVDPPKYFAAGNVTPGALTTQIALAATGSAAAGFATPDGQFVANLPAGAIATSSGAAHVQVRVTPIAPRRLAVLPDGLRADGNAYHVEMTYQPGGAPVSRLTKPGTLLVEFPEIGNGLFRSPDGRSWTRVASRTIEPRELSVAAAFDGNGYYEIGTNLPELTNATRTSSHRALWLGVAVAVIAIILFLSAMIVGRRRVKRHE
jgi:hypothetical protein